MTKVYDEVDLSHKRKILVVGDIHGCFSELKARLKDHDFDPEQDALVSVGDLIDRGPESSDVMDWLAKPWFYRVIGNHEEFARDGFYGDETAFHIRHGGRWLYTDFPILAERKRVVDNLMDASYLLKVKTPNGYNIGFCHAYLPYSNWQDNIDNPSFSHFTMSRQGVLKLHNPFYDPSIEGIDHVFFGHNAIEKAYTRGNCTWVDTGAGFTDGYITVVDAEKIIEAKDEYL